MPKMKLKLAIMRGENYTFMGFGLGDLEATQVVKMAYRDHRKQFPSLPPFEEYVDEYGIDHFEATPFKNLTLSR